MRNIIENGEYVIFERRDSYDESNKPVVLVQHHGIEDSETGGSYSVKRFTKDPESGKTIFKADTDIPYIEKHTTFEVNEENKDDIRIVAEFIQIYNVQ